MHGTSDGVQIRSGTHNDVLLLCWSNFLVNKKRKSLITWTNLVFCKYFFFSVKSRYLPSDLWPKFETDIKQTNRSSALCSSVSLFYFSFNLFLDGVLTCGYCVQVTPWTPNKHQQQQWLSRWLWHCNIHSVTAQHNGHVWTKQEMREDETDIHYHRKAKWFSTLFSNEKTLAMHFLLFCVSLLFFFSSVRLWIPFRKVVAHFGNERQQKQSERETHSVGVLRSKRKSSLRVPSALHSDAPRSRLRCFCYVWPSLKIDVRSINVRSISARILASTQRRTHFDQRGEDNLDLP